MISEHGINTPCSHDLPPGNRGAGRSCGLMTTGGALESPRRTRANATTLLRSAAEADPPGKPSHGTTAATPWRLATLPRFARAANRSPELVGRCAVILA